MSNATSMANGTGAIRGPRTYEEARWLIARVANALHAIGAPAGVPARMGWEALPESWNDVWSKLRRECVVVKNWN